MLQQFSLDAPMNSEDQRTLEEVVESDSFNSPEENVVNNELSGIVQSKIDFCQKYSMKEKRRFGKKDCLQTNPSL